MQVQFRADLLVLMLLSCSAPSAAEECNLPERMQQLALHKLSGKRWVLVESFSDYPRGEELMKITNSSITVIHLKDNNESFMFTERNVVAGKCLIFRGNLSIPDPETSNHSLLLDNTGESKTGRDWTSWCTKDQAGVREFEGVVVPYDDKGRADVYQTCPHCLIIVYHGVFEGMPGRFLLIYRSEGKHLDADELKAAASDHRRIAECLKFNVEISFRYNGKAEFCQEKKKEQEEA